MTATIDDCSQCLYWAEETPTDEDGESDGVCRRYPPVSVLDGEGNAVRDDEGVWVGRPCHSFIYWAQPRVCSCDWCGEFRPADSD